MSTLLEQASLVMIPSGYKEDVVYSQIPTNGNGDLSFTRASNGTRVNSAGLVEVVAWNLLTYSEQFNNAIWNKRSGVTITADSTTAPNGTTTADTANYSSGDGYIWQELTLLPSTQYTISVYAKGSSGSIQFNAFWGTGSAISSTTALTSEWQRLTFTFTTGSTTSVGDFGFFISATCYIYGAQLNIGSTAKPYFPTTDRLNVPRLTYQNGGGGCPSLLLEKQSTNLILNSQNLAESSWTTADNTRTANYATSPDGTSNATRIIPNTNNNPHPTYVVFTISSATSITAFAKSDGYNFFQIYGGEASGASGSSARFSVVVNLSNGTIDTIDTITSSQVVISAMNNGWYKITISNFTQFTSGNYFLAVSAVNASGLTRNSVLDVSFAGNGTSGVLAYGIQVEQSSYPTSYIPTTSSSATRVADACSKTGISSLIGQTEGTILLDWKQNAFNDSQGIYANNYNLTGSISIQISTNGTLVAYVCYGGIFFAITTSSNAIQVGQRYKIGLAYKSGDCALYLNGNLIGTNTTSFAFTTTLSQIDLSNSTVFFANLSEISVNELVQIKTRISNADIQSWTS